MFENSEARPMIAVGNIRRAEKFYGETLGLNLKTQGEMPMLHCQTGGVDFLIYESKFAGTVKLAWFKDPDGNILHVLNA